MKFLALAICLPMVFAAQSLENRALEAQLASLLDAGALKTDSQILLDLVGEEFTDEDCQLVCTKVGQYLVHHCPSVCKSMQELKSAFRLSANPDGKILRRSLFGGFDLHAAKADLQYLVDMVGSDPTEQVCENTLRNYATAGGILVYAIPVICKGAQTLIKLLHITPDTTTTHGPPGKRTFLHGFHISDLFDLDSLKNDVQMIVDVLGSDPTEQACEQEAHKLIADGTLFNVAVPLMCNGLQTLIRMLHITRDPTTTHMP